MKKHSFYLVLLVSLFFSCNTAKQQETVLYVPSIFISAIDIEKDNAFHKFQEAYSKSNILLASKGEESVTSTSQYPNPEGEKLVENYVADVNALNKSRADYLDLFQDLVEANATKGPVRPPLPPPVPPIGPSPCNCLPDYVVSKTDILTFRFGKAEGVNVKFNNENSNITTTKANKGGKDISLNLSKLTAGSNKVTIENGNLSQDINLIIR